jgi:putative nucleotidyltransferase with HDIG domain
MVLFVDDDLQILKSLEREFRSEPYKVRYASSGSSALDMISTPEEEVEVIISDQRMPNMSGTEFLIRSQEFAPHAVRMIMTGFSDFQVTIDAINKGGVTHYITKPWDKDELLLLVRDSIVKYRESDKSRIEIQKILEHQRNDQIKFRELVGALTGFIDLSTPSSKRHAMRTSQLAVGIAVSLGLEPEELEKIRMGAILHDIGLNTLSNDAGEFNPACMSETQYALFRSHPVIGQSMIGTVDSLQEIALIVRHHHENFDGSGFPDGLAGKDIPLGAAIISLANYAEGEIEYNSDKMPLHEQLEKITAKAGTEFDPQLIPHLLRVVEDMHHGR